MIFLDTQVVSYAFLGKPVDALTGTHIASVVASEFLLQLGKDPRNAEYYVPAKKHDYFYQGIGSSPRRIHPVSKHGTDRIVMEFGGDFEPIVQYSNYAIANVINTRQASVFYDAIAFVEKERRKLIKHKFDFLMDSDIKCKPLGRSTVDTAHQLLEDFMLHHNAKSNFRNTWNDLLIYAGALQYEGSLITNDSELSRFISQRHSSTEHSLDDPFVRLNFQSPEESPVRTFRESKGYVNRGWQVQFYR